MPDTRRNVTIALTLLALARFSFDKAAWAADAAQPAGVEAPPKGQTRLCIFRPSFTDTGKNDRPILSFDGTPAMELAVETYTSWVISPGVYEVSIKPNAGEPAAWQATYKVSASADETRFLAIWNNFGVVSLGHAIHLLGPWGALLNGTSYSTTVRFQLVDEKEAVSAHRSMAYVAPMNERHTTKP